MSRELINSVKDEMKFFKNREVSGFPRADIGRKGFTYHIDCGGEYFTLENDIMDYIVSEHNLDSFRNQAIAFNTTSRLVEKLNPDLAVPKVLHDENMTIQYPLPDDLKLLPTENENWKLNEEKISRLYEIEKLGNFELTLTPSYQMIESEFGKIFVRDGMLEVQAKKAHREFSWIASKIMGASFRENM